jgi:ComF family protein
VFESVLDALFPAACAGCGCAGAVLCASCTPPPGAAAPLRIGALHVRAVGRYDGGLRAAILTYKRGRRDVGNQLAALLAERVALGLGHDAVLVPVPTAPKRRRERGFDQGHRLAEHLGLRAGRPVLLALRRRDGDAQRGRSRAERLQARGHFICIAPELVTGMRIVLVDDVVTTGSTLLDCAASLQECGAFVREAVVLAYA